MIAIVSLLALALLAFAIRQERVNRAHARAISRARGDVAALARRVSKCP